MAAHFAKSSSRQVDELSSIAKQLVAPGKGILFSDESPGQLEKMLTTFGILGNERKRIEYRNMLFSVNGDVSNYVSGVCVHSEVLDQKSETGCTLCCQLRRRETVLGVRADTGLVPLSCTANETTTQGLDDLTKRCSEYKNYGFDFTKWRAELLITENTPSALAIAENTNTLAKFAALSQAQGMVPLLDVDIRSKGDNELERAEEVTATVLSMLFKALADQHVILEGMLLKVNMVKAGPKCAKNYSPGQVAQKTLRTLRRTVPAAVPEIGSLKRLEQLNISKNQLKRLPVQLSECQQLNELNLSDNTNIWHIPERISNLQSLQSLSADRCALIYLPVALSKFLNHVRIFHNTSITHVPMVYEKFFQTFYDNRAKVAPMLVTHDSFFWVLEKETNTKLLLPIGTRRIFAVPSQENLVTLYDDCLRAVQYLGRFMPIYENVALHRLLPEKFMVDHVNNAAIARCTVFTCANPLYTTYYFMVVKRRGSTSKQLFTCNFCSHHCANLWLQDNTKKYYQVDWEVWDE